MEIVYKRSMSDNYMVISGEDVQTEKSYQTRMLLENQIHGLLPCKKQKVNGEELFYYEITGCQSLGNLFEKRKFDRKELEKLFFSVLRIMEHLDEYLLNRDNLLLQPSCIFKGKEDDMYYFVWVPTLNGSIEREFRQLTEYILPKIDHTDKDAVTLGYGVYKEATESNIQMEVLKSQIYLQKDNYEKENEDSINQHEMVINQEQKKILDEFYEEDDENKWEIKDKIGAFLMVFIAIGFLWAVRNFFVSGVLYTVLGVIALAGVGFWWYKTRYKEKKETFYENQEIGVEIEEIKREYKQEIGATVVLNEEQLLQAYLEEVGREDGRKFFLEREVMTIGKWEEHADICLNLPTVSRLHAKIIRKEGKDFIMDMNSRNGTMLNNMWINPEQEYELKNGDMLVFAEKKMRYVFVNG